MPRKLKPYKVDRVTNSKTGVGVDILLDREDRVFFGMVGPTRIQSDTADECKKRVRNALRNYKGLEWKGFIILNAEETEHGWSNNGFKVINTGLNLTFHRLMGAKTSDGAWTCKPFEEDVHPDSPFSEEDRMKLWYRDARSKKIIPYTQEVWSTLMEMHKRIKKMGKDLEKFCKRKNIGKLLTQAGAMKMLGAGGK